MTIKTLRNAIDQIPFMDTYSRRTIGDNIVVLSRFKLAKGGMSEEEKAKRAIGNENLLVGVVFRGTLERLIDKHGPTIAKKIDFSKLYLPIDPKKKPLRVGWTMRVGCHKSLEQDVAEAIVEAIAESPLEGVTVKPRGVRTRNFMDGAIGNEGP
jgi:hypothetical protein